MVCSYSDFFDRNLLHCGWYLHAQHFLTSLAKRFSGIAYYLIYLEKFRVYTNLKIFYRIHRYRYFLK